MEKTTSWVVVGVGAGVSIIGATLLTGTFGAGVTGFGLAHVLLGFLDMARSPVKAE